MQPDSTEPAPRGDDRRPWGEWWSEKYRQERIKSGFCLLMGVLITLVVAVDGAAKAPSPYFQSRQAWVARVDAQSAWWVAYSHSSSVDWVRAQPTAHKPDAYAWRTVPWWSALHRDSLTRDCTYLDEIAVGRPFRCLIGRTRCIRTDEGHGEDGLTTVKTGLLEYGSDWDRRSIPVRPLFLGLMADVIFFSGLAALAVYALPAFYRWQWRWHEQQERRRLQQARDNCAECGYDITHLLSRRCPECGTPILPPPPPPEAPPLARSKLVETDACIVPANTDQSDTFGFQWTGTVKGLRELDMTTSQRSHRSGSH